MPPIEVEISFLHRSGVPQLKEQNYWCRSFFTLQIGCLFLQRTLKEKYLSDYLKKDLPTKEKTREKAGDFPETRKKEFCLRMDTEICPGAPLPDGMHDDDGTSSFTKTQCLHSFFKRWKIN
ncbi:hypothetical protein F0562_028505 [Nyssa sinensis]|uniref:Uncharacterized protein n=1 Tax=Nyssa sinensis TaxID=561372 RepID=A0A5J5B2K5_9ASTE|nr:hypothetical protein F0562_028505 [Nyssa sinensis]